MKKAIYLLSIILISLSCTKNHQKADIVAEINGEAIYQSDLESIIQQEIFDELNRIYTIKDLALNNLIEEKILLQEAKKYNITKEEYLNNYTNSFIKKYTIDSLVKKYKIDKNVSHLYRTSLMTVPVDTYEGKILQEQTLKYIIKKQLLDSLLQNSKINKYIYPPKSPNLNLDHLASSYRGNLNSKNSLLIISDFECSKCLEFHHIYDSIFSKYKDKVKFGYIHYSGFPTPLIMASEAANKQNKFWDFHDIVYTSNDYIDSTKIFNIAKGLGLNLEIFKKDMESDSNKNEILKNFKELRQDGIYATPTIIINNRILFNSGSFDEISKLLDEEIGKNN